MTRLVQRVADKSSSRKLECLNLATATCEDRCFKLLPQPQIVAMVPYFYYLPIRKSEDVDARKLSRLASGFDATPTPRIRAPSSPASRYQIALSEDQIDVKF